MLGQQHEEFEPKTGTKENGGVGGERENNKLATAGNKVNVSALLLKGYIVCFDCARPSFS